MSGPSAKAAIRRAALDDVDAIAALHQRAWRASHGRILPVLELADHERAQQWRGLVEGDAMTILVAEGPRARGLVGVVTAELLREGPRAVTHIRWLYVDPIRWGRGIGRALLEAAVRHGRELGAAGAELLCLVQNQNALKFYDHLGAQRLGVERVVVRGLITEQIRLSLPHPFESWSVTTPG